MNVIFQVDKPKKPMKAFGSWKEATLPAMKKQHPTLSKGELAKEMAEIWKNFPPERHVNIITNKNIHLT